MMEFLDKIYGYEHFGVILFSVILLLVVLFLVVLFFGKKDEKKRELERTQQMNQPVTDTFAEVNAEPVPVNVEEPKFAPIENVTEPIVKNEAVTPIETVNIPVEPAMPVQEVVASPVEVAPILQPVVEPEIVTSNVEIPVTPTPISEPAVVEQPVQEVVVTPVEEQEYDEIEIPDFNFDELAASIAQELNDLENTKDVERASIKEETVKMPEPIINPMVNDTPVTPMNEIVRPIEPRPVQTFSSVYINKPSEPAVPVREALIEPEVKEPIKPIANPVPVQNPNIELPKPAEMPILKQDVASEPEKKEANNISNFPNFPNFEGESYNLK